MNIRLISFIFFYVFSLSQLIAQSDENIKLSSKSNRMSLCIHKVEFYQNMIFLPAVCADNKIKEVIFNVSKTIHESKKSELYNNMFSKIIKNSSYDDDSIKNDMKMIWQEKTQNIFNFAHDEDLKEVFNGNLLDHRKFKEHLSKLSQNRVQISNDLNLNIIEIRNELKFVSDNYNVLEILLAHNIDYLDQIKELKKISNVGNIYIDVLMEYKRRFLIRINYYKDVLQKIAIFKDLNKINITNLIKKLEGVSGSKKYIKKTKFMKDVRNDLALLNSKKFHHTREDFKKLSKMARKYFQLHNTYYYGSRSDRFSNFQNNVMINDRAYYMRSLSNGMDVIPVDQNYFFKELGSDQLSKASYMSLNLNYSDFLPLSVKVKYTKTVLVGDSYVKFYASKGSQRILWKESLNSNDNPLYIHADPRTIEGSSIDLFNEWFLQPEKNHSGAVNAQSYIDFIYKNMSVEYRKKTSKQAFLETARPLETEIEPIAFSDKTFHMKKIVFDVSLNEKAEEFFDHYHLSVYDPSLVKYLDVLMEKRDLHSRIHQTLMNGFMNLNIYLPSRFSDLYPYTYISSDGTIETIQKSSGHCKHQNYLNHLSKLYQNRKVEVFINPIEIIKYSKDWQCDHFPDYVKDHLEFFIQSYEASSEVLTRKVKFPVNDGSLLDLYKKTLPTIWLSKDNNPKN